MKNLFDISNEIIVLTGVNGILGYEYANYLLGQNAKVIGIDIIKSENTSTLINKYKSKFSFYDCDLTCSDSLSNIVAKIITENGIPTVLINNAAIDSPPLHLSKRTVLLKITQNLHGIK